MPSCPNLTGDISVLSNLTRLAEFSFSFTQVYGDIAVFNGLSSTVRSINFVKTQVSGDISAFANCLQVFHCNLGQSAQVYGDINSFRNLTNLQVLHVNST